MQGFGVALRFSYTGPARLASTLRTKLVKATVRALAETPAAVRLSAVHTA